MSLSLPPLSLYLHLPWCVRKCPYCDFNSHKAGEAQSFGRYTDALIADIRDEARLANGRRVESIFLGGGTPSLFSPALIGRVLETCDAYLQLAEDCEITMEANPGTVEHGSLKEYRSIGVTRLSVGAQTFDPVILKTLGRIHGPDEIIATVEEARAACFESVNVDLMFALPGQTPEAAARDVRAVIELEPAHVSYYQLTLEPNTVFHRQPPAGIPDDDQAWQIQTLGHALLAGSGYAQYEISAFSMPGHRSRHNLNYWQFGDYLAAGAGAHGKLTRSSGRIERYSKPMHPLTYMEQVERHDVDRSLRFLDRRDLDFEFMLNGLRLTDGVSIELFRQRTGIDPAEIAHKISAAVEDGLLVAPGDGTWRPTADGFRLLNDLQARFLP
jgi:oxygen-independent coproporphyrinogen-3 oxidase